MIFKNTVAINKWVDGPAWTGVVRAKIEGNNLVTYTW